MALATVGAFAIGQFPEGVSVMIFYATGEFSGKTDFDPGVDTFNLPSGPLFVAKYKIYPFVKVLRNVFRFKCLTMFANKVVGIRSPLRKNDIVDALFRPLQFSKIEVI